MSTHPLARASRVPILLALTLVAVSPTPAQPQVGGLIRRAKQALQKPADSSSNIKGKAFTEASITALLKGLRAASAKANERDALRAQQQAKQTRLSALLEQHPEQEVDHFNDVSQRATNCQDDFFDKREEGHDATARAAGMSLMADPAKQQKYIQIQSTYSQQIQAAQAKGDTAAAAALTLKQFNEIAKLLGVDFHADTVAAIKECGPVPDKPGWLSEEETLRSEIDKLGGQIRDAEFGMQQVGAQESGMAPQDYALARERVLQWLAASENGDTPSGFSPDEHKALSEHRNDFNQVKNAL